MRASRTANRALSAAYPSAASLVTAAFATRTSVPASNATSTASPDGTVTGRGGSGRPSAVTATSEAIGCAPALRTVTTIWRRSIAVFDTERFPLEAPASRSASPMPSGSTAPA